MAFRQLNTGHSDNKSGKLTTMLPIYPKVDATQTTAFSGKVRRLFFLIVVICLLCFIPTLFNTLLDWDDAGYINENKNIQSLSFETVLWAFTEFHNNYWAPLTWLSLAVDYAVWGLNPIGYHLTNNLLHALNAGMFFLLSFNLLTGYLTVRPSEDGKPSLLNSQNALYCSLFAALFFGLHPLRVESVAWATERKDVLSIFFGILSTIVYLRYAQAQPETTGRSEQTASFFSSHAYRLSVILFCLSLLSKVTLITLPAVFLVMDWFPLRRITRTTIRKILMEKVPYIILAIPASALTVKAFAGDIKTLEYSDLFTRVLFAFNAIITYLKMTVWPLKISPVYLHPGKIAAMNTGYLLPILVFIGITAFCVYSFRRRPLFLSIWLIYLISLFPVLGLVQAGSTYMAARFTYVPGLAISVLIALGITAAVVRLSGSSLRRSSMIAVAVLILLFNSFITVRDIGFWKDDVTLWTRVIAVQPRVMGLAYLYRSLAFENIGDHQRALRDISQAFKIAEQKNYRGIHEIYVVRARVFKKMGDLDRAVDDLTTAIGISTYPKNHFYYIERGMIYEEQGKPDLAAEDFRIAASADQVH